MPTQPPDSCSIDTDDRPLDFWEFGPVRRIIDMEFEMALSRLNKDHSIEVTPEAEKKLRDAVVPLAFHFMTEAARWPELEGDGAALSLQHQQEIQRMMTGALALALGSSHGVMSVQTTYRFSRSLLFRWMPAIVRKFLIP